ncbi:hypothetical protein DO97_01910 [Neosynechococcus sphagnicola sy1]|uniref:Uncharacterized protein n=2 Tax=Neosynechococcus TaxID=1501143 RepID=A0A098TLC9_9CYAN|nr:hypothetical protein DO97_01910 [Neosynechococcus sphagnicola sy1]
MLGVILHEAGLISPPQIEVALREQAQLKHLQLGEILSLHGWLKQETADFFAERWGQLLNQDSDRPLGFYLKEAALLTEAQIQELLKEQWQTRARFGSLAVLKGWIKEPTLKFFIANLRPQHLTHSNYIQVQQSEGHIDTPKPPITQEVLDSDDLSFFQDDTLIIDDFKWID